jgi:GPH family glycoside/pentoside/hexuronide:cation symporter
VHLGLIEAARISLKNPLFLPYAGAVGGYKMATAVAVIGVPFIATQLMGVNTETAGAMLAVIIVVAALTFPLVQSWSGRFGAARVYGWGGIGFVVVLPLMGLIGLTQVVPPLAQGVVLFALSGFSVACVMVLPRAMLAEVIDRDQATTGLRREAMYNGMSGVVEKLGEAMAWGVAGVLFGQFGNSASSPLGLRLLGVGAAGGVALGLWSLSRYRRGR